MWFYFILNFATMFTIQTAVTIVTAGLASELFGLTENMVIWSVIITVFCSLILIFGKYKTLDKVIKIIIIVLAISSVLAISIALVKNDSSISIKQIFPSGGGLLFLIAFMGWMPAPLDISIWHSIWTLEKNKIQKKKIKIADSMFDFNVGYITTVILGLCFIGLGALVMNGSGESFSNQGGVFAKQLIKLYTSNLGEGAYLIIAIAAFTTMFSTTITTLDASPRAMSRTIQLLFNKEKDYYITWIIILAVGTSLIFIFLLSEMGKLVQIATVLSFITAPIYAFLNYKLVNSDQVPKDLQPDKKLKLLSNLGLIFLTGFTLFYLLSLAS